VTLGVFVEGSKHDWQDDFYVVANQVTKVFIVPEVQGSFCHLMIISKGRANKSWLNYLEMRTGDGFGELMEKRILNFGKFPRVHDLEYILHFIEKHDFFGAIYLWPVSQQTKDDLQILLDRFHSTGRLSLTSSVKAASFSKNCTIQYANWG
jgi:hypothetical protein